MICAGIEGRNFLSGNQRVQRLGHIANAYSQIGSPRAINHHPHFRLSGDQGRINVNYIGKCFQLRQKIGRICRQLIEVGTADHKTNIRVPLSASGNRGYGIDTGPKLRHFFQVFANDFRARAQHQILLRPRTFFDRRHLDINIRKVDDLLLAATDSDQRVGHAG